MISRQRFLGVMVVLTLTFALVLGLGFTRTVQGGVGRCGHVLRRSGPVWGMGRPWKIMGRSGVPTRWRRTGGPIPTGAGCPPTTAMSSRARNRGAGPPTTTATGCPPKNNGWVWVPGRTWYPSTVEWRTSPESEPVDTSYVGWAPTPPPNYEPAGGVCPGGLLPGKPRGGFAVLASLDFRQGGPVSAGFRAAVYVELFLYELRVSWCLRLMCRYSIPRRCIIQVLRHPDLLPGGFFRRSAIRFGLL